MATNRYRALLNTHRPLEGRTPCGYCRLPLARIGIGERGFEVDHIMPRSQYPALAMVIINLTWACVRCNGKKSDYTNGFDPDSGRFHDLFNPNREHWMSHFSSRADGKIHGLTTTGRATGERLKLNAERMLLELRADGYEAGWWPA